MGTILASAILSRASTLLFDVPNIKWSQAELLEWLSDAQRATVALLPEASSQVSVVQLAVGVRQPLPSGAWLLLEVVRQMSTDGVTPGRTLKRVDRAVLDESTPLWAAATPVSLPNLYMYNARDKAAFYVSPPADGTGYVEINVSQHPTEITDPSTPITVDDIYAPALLDYVLWRAHSKMTPFAGDPKDAATYLQSWATFVSTDAAAAAKLVAEMGHFGIAPAQTEGSAQGGQ